MSDAPTFDRDATKEALDMWGRFGPPRPGTGTPLSDLNQIVQAARWAVEVTEGDGIWWCERHQCRWGYAPNCGWSPRGEACPKSRRLLIEWEAE